MPESPLIITSSQEFVGAICAGRFSPERYCVDGEIGTRVFVRIPGFIDLEWCVNFFLFKEVERHSPGEVVRLFKECHIFSEERKCALRGGRWWRSDDFTHLSLVGTVGGNGCWPEAHNHVTTLCLMACILASCEASRCVTFPEFVEKHPDIMEYILLNAV
jgi:hypothetical protein